MWDCDNFGGGLAIEDRGRWCAILVLFIIVVDTADTTGEQHHGDQNHGEEGVLHGAAMDTPPIKASLTGWSRRTRGISSRE